MTRISSLLAGAALLASVTVAVPASAATLLYSFAPASATAPSFTFDIDSNPTPVSRTPFVFATTIRNLTVNGVARNATDFTFTVLSFGGGLSSSAAGSYLGPQLFSGTTTTPTMLTGNFNLIGGPASTGGTLNVTTLAAAVPETGTWAMMILGMGLAGSALRRRKVTTRVSYAT